eukprot:XP_001708836.1 Hypothetical protein GL50803_17545 [Giardia lamblia ATCC 50803]
MLGTQDRKLIPTVRDDGGSIPTLEHLVDVVVRLYGVGAAILRSDLLSVRGTVLTRNLCDGTRRLLQDSGIQVRYDLGDSVRHFYLLLPSQMIFVEEATVRLNLLEQVYTSDTLISCKPGSEQRFFQQLFCL